MAKYYPITVEALRQNGWSRASTAMLDAKVKTWAEVSRKYPFNTAQRCAIFWGEITFECDGGLEERENLSYSVARIVQVFGPGVHSAAITADEAKTLAHNPYGLAERAYGLGNPHIAKVLGNTQPGDGYNCRGGGDLNSTGREAFTRIGKALGIDLVGNSKLLDDPGICLLAGAEEYSELGCIEMSDSGDINRVTKTINGALNGLNDRKTLISQWQSYFETLTPEEIDGAPTTTETTMRDGALIKPDATLPQPAAPVAPAVTALTLPATLPGPHPSDGIAALAGIGSVIGVSHALSGVHWIIAVVACAVVAVAIFVVWASFRHRPANIAMTPAVSGTGAPATIVSTTSERSAPSAVAISIPAAPAIAVAK